MKMLLKVIAWSVALLLFVNVGEWLAVNAGEMLGPIMLIAICVGLGFFIRGIVRNFNG
jgi:hypothetical protein